MNTFTPPINAKLSKNVAAGIEPLEDRIAPATIVVTNLNDSGAGSLRDAINTANGTAGADEIKFAPGLEGTISLASNLPFITDSLAIKGGGRIGIDGNNNFRPFFIFSGASFIAVKLTGLKLFECHSTGFGGAIDNFGEQVVLKNSLISGCTVSGVGNGGAIYSGGASASLKIINSTITNNSNPVNDGGAVNVASGKLVIQNSIISGNSAVGNGGGVSAAGDSVKIINTKFTGNSAPNAGADGGGLFANVESVQIVQSVFSGNLAFTDGGGFYLRNTGTQAGSSVFIERTTCTGNNATNGGGGLVDSAFEQVTVSGARFLGNTAGSAGAGLYFVGNANTKAVIVDSIFVGNTATNNDGGGLFVDSTGKTNVIDCEFSFNVAGDEGGGIALFSGGANLKFISSIITNNYAEQTGGGIDNNSGNTAKLVGCVIKQNVALTDAQLSGPFTIV